MGRKRKLIELGNHKKVLTVFAHPDDETLAAGGTISKLSRLGSEVHVSIPATGIHSRKRTQGAKERDNHLEKLRSDCVVALEKLGVQKRNIYLGEFADNAMDGSTLLEAIHWVEDVIERVNPTLILTHHRYCTNIDHQYCHEAVVVAARPSVNSRVTVLCGEVPSSTGYLSPVQWEPNLYVEISADDLENKIISMESYKGEARPDPHPRSREVLSALAKVRGSEAGFFFAEAFMVQRTFA